MRGIEIKSINESELISDYIWNNWNIINFENSLIYQCSYKKKLLMEIRVHKVNTWRAEIEIGIVSIQKVKQCILTICKFLFLNEITLSYITSYLVSGDKLGFEEVVRWREVVEINNNYCDILALSMLKEKITCYSQE